MLRAILVVASTLLSLTATARAATYYVSASASNASDANAGTSEAAPWKTVAQVNAATFAPGDVILFRRGDAWTEQLVVSSSGTAGALLTFGAYGSGARPLLDAGTVPTGYTVLVDNRSYVHVRDLHIRTGFDGGAFGGGVFVCGPNDTVEGCIVEGEVVDPGIEIVGIRTMCNTGGLVLENHDISHATVGIKATTNVAGALLIEGNFVHELDAGNPNDQDGIGVSSDGIDYAGTVIRGNEVTAFLGFPKGVRLKPGETVVFAFIIYRSKAHRDAVNAKVMKDPSMALAMPKKMPFDPKRFLFGGFKTLVEG